MIQKEYQDLFYNFGKNIRIEKNVTVNLPNRICLMDNITLDNNCQIIVHSDYYNQSSNWNLKISNNVYIGKNAIIEIIGNVQILDKVMIASGAYISDTSHEYRDFTISPCDQGMVSTNNKLIIKEGAWIGAHATVVGNITIGYGVVVGANSFVNKDIPDHCVVGGVPAKIIKICDYRTDGWISVKDNEKILNDILINRGKFKGYAYYENMRKMPHYQAKKKNSKGNNVDNKDSEKENVEYILEECINYTYKANILLNEGKNEEFFNVLIQLVEGIDNVQKYISKGSNNDNKINIISKTLNDGLNAVVNFYEQKNFSRIINIYSKEFISAFEVWKNTVEEMLKSKVTGTCKIM